MHKQGIYKILSNQGIADQTFEMVLEGDTSYFTNSGQFVNIALEGKFLRRPISVCDYDQKQITLIYRVVGEGTQMMSRMCAGEILDLLTALGNGFSINGNSKKPLLVGGSCGVAPLYGLAKQLVALGGQVSVVCGFATKDDIFYADKFKEIGVELHIATNDGSYGTKGFVTDLLKNNEIEYDYFYCCGPMPMMKAICEMTTVDGECSLEAHMGCGFGACMGCSCKTTVGSKRVCKEGPVFKKNEIVW